jgi:hypothetical protein
VSGVGADQTGRLQEGLDGVVVLDVGEAQPPGRAGFDPAYPGNAEGSRTAIGELEFVVRE